MQSEIDRELRLELASGEKLLWSGQPGRGLRFRGADALLIPFSLMWGAQCTAGWRTPRGPEWGSSFPHALNGGERQAGIRPYSKRPTGIVVRRRLTIDGEEALVKARNRAERCSRSRSWSLHQNRSQKHRPIAQGGSYDVELVDSPLPRPARLFAGSRFCGSRVCPSA
jgi:hypothetical protein